MTTLKTVASETIVVLFWLSALLETLAFKNILRVELFRCINFIGKYRQRDVRFVILL